MVRTATNAIVSCIHNPEAGHECDSAAPAPTVPAGRARHVVIVGGGPAGMETALVAARRGHRVTLLERADELGGAPRALAEAGQRVPFGLVSSWRVARLAELDVDVRPRVDATPALVRELRPDVVVVATGARPRPVEGLPGADLRHVVSVREALAGTLPGAGRVVVVDRQGSYPAIDAARRAAGAGRPVTVLAEEAVVSSQLGGSGEISPWYRDAAGQGIDLRPLTTVVEVLPNALRLRHRYGTAEDTLPSDCVVLADFELPDDELYLRLAAELPGLEIRRVGDCVAPRRVLQAVLEGGRAGRAI
jgi:2,4-dienoyl-CoA reductase (NADPH2)